MTIYLDDQPLDLQAPDLAQALEGARGMLQPRGRMVVEVIIDGQRLTGAELERRQHEALGEAELRLYSALPRELAGEALAQAREQLELTRQAMAEAADLFQRDQPNQAMQSLGRAVEIWQMVQQTLASSAQLVGMDLEQQSFEDKPLRDWLAALAGSIRTLRDLIAGGDTVGLADTLAFEWPEVIGQWQRLIDQMIFWVAAPTREG